MASTKRATFFILLAACGIGIALWAARDKPSDAPGVQSALQTPQHSTLSETALNFSADLISNDLEAALNGGKSLFTEEEALRLSGVDLKSDALTYEEDYNQNEIAADSKYRGKKLLILGRVKQINKNAFGQGYFELRGSNPFIGVEAILRDDALAWAQAVKRGESVAIVCDPGVRIANVATLSGCQGELAFLGSAKPHLRQLIQRSLQGADVVTVKEAKVMAGGYAIGAMLPPGSPCFTDLNAKGCAHDVELAKNPGLKGKIDGMVAHMKTAP